MLPPVFFSNIQAKEKKINKHIDKVKKPIVKLYLSQYRKQGGKYG